MTRYTYTLNYTDRFGNTETIGMGTEEQMFRTALALDKESATLNFAGREVWEITDHIAHLVKVEPYRNGKPVTT